MGEGLPKAFVEIGGSTMLALATDGLIASGVVDHIVIMVPADLIDTTRALVPVGAVPISVVAGGAERTDSVRAGLAAAPEATHVLVHDAARALTPPDLTARVVAELRAGHPAVVPGLPVTDTIKSIDPAGAVTGTPDRTLLRAVQTPQGFEVGLLRKAHALLDTPGEDNDRPTITDDAGLVELLGVPVRVIAGDARAFKITTPLDLHLARTLCAGPEAVVR
ncbi:2-C-methyl-D-erythritol 4-phosphate cytidylyltransferase [Nocardia sp. RB56]|uniref:2-C-methyl-D-erythritol 4-phosphate cytidylyltransferase n=1 Tax=Nocardia aurantia TaxID=2585199 RepID=A0A7K0DFF1_9NOCA|nr:2-C-methyl-D-erythritol 4-phosphate cytidylyltransferase [Nocardia aurantia]